MSYCATCDAAFFRDRETIVVGDGDSAMEEAIFLARFSCKLMIVHRRNEFRASRIMVECAEAMPNTAWLTPYAVAELVAGEQGSLDRVVVRNDTVGVPTPAPLAGAGDSAEAQWAPAPPAGSRGNQPS